MRILFSTFGSLGDIHPYLAIAIEAKARGHEPILATSPKYRAKIEAEGIGFRAVRPDLPENDEFGAVAKQVMNSKSGSEYLFKDLLSPTLKVNYTDLLTTGEDVDCIITHPAALGGPLAARKLKKPWLSSVLSPISLWSRHDPPVPPTLPATDRLRVFGPLWGATSLASARFATRSWVKAVHELAETEGIESGGHPIFEGSFSPHGTLALFSPHFAAPQRDWPTNSVACGFCFFDKSGYAEQSTSEWQSWVSHGEPPMVFTLGSAAVFDSEAFFRSSRTAVQETKVRAAYLTGGTVQWPQGAAPSGERELDVVYASYSDLFPQARAVVHQGGIGTTAQALRAGVPQIIVPFAHDQPDNAARLRRLGVGIPITRAQYENGAAAGILRRLIEQENTLRAHARNLAAKIQAENGPQAACAAIERLILG